MSKLERWLTLVANLSVVAGIVFLAAEMRQNTEAIRGQTRDSITEKQTEYLSWMATSPELAASLAKIRSEGWETLTPDEYEARSQFWRLAFTGNNAAAFTDILRNFRVSFAPSFRAEIDRIVAVVEQAQ